MMRNKSKLSKAILRSKSAQRFLKLKEKLEEIHLKSSYQENSQEKKAIEKIKKNPKVFFSYAKRFSKTNADIGPFFSRKSSQDPEVIVEMLKEQYDSVFPKPDTEKDVENPTMFFPQNSQILDLIM